MFVQAIKRGYVCVLSSIKPPVDSYLYVCLYVIEAVFKCSREKRPEMYVDVPARSSVGKVFLFVRHIHSPVDSYLCVYVYVCKHSSTIEPI